MSRTSAYGTGPLLKAVCPACNRLISGGRVVDKRGYVIRLRKHKRWNALQRAQFADRGNEDCPGSGREVEMER